MAQLDAGQKAQLKDAARLGYVDDPSKPIEERVNLAVEYLRQDLINYLENDPQELVFEWTPAKTKATGNKRLAAVVEVAIQYGDYDGAMHKQWVIAQMLKAALGTANYKTWLKACEDVSYPFDEGIAP